MPVVPETYREWWRSYKPLSYSDRLTVTQAGLRPVPGLEPERAASAIAYGRYVRRFMLVTPVAVVLLLAALSVVLDLSGLRSPAALLAFVGMTAITAVVWLSSKRAEQENYKTLTRESA